jgi:hypothetical protein
MGRLSLLSGDARRRVSWSRLPTVLRSADLGAQEDEAMIATIAMGARSARTRRDLAVLVD